MEPLTVSVAFLGLAVIANAVSWFFKTPKETSLELVSRIAVNETEHRNLERDFIKSHVRLGEKVDTLASAVKDLSISVKELAVRVERGYAR
jgi:hypothetical protein